MAVAAEPDGPVLFTLSKTQNANQVVYAVRVDPQCRPSGESPVHAWWWMLSRGAPHREPILALEERAYGVAHQQVVGLEETAGRVELSLKALPVRALTVETRRAGQACEASAITQVDGRAARLLHVHARTAWPFRVESIVLSGGSLEDQTPLFETIQR